MASFHWLHVCPWGQSWKVELHKHILREYSGEKKGKAVDGLWRPPRSVAGPSSPTAYTTWGDNYTGWVSIARVCSGLPVVPQESLEVCVWRTVCACVNITGSFQPSHSFAYQKTRSLDTDFQTKTLTPLKRQRPSPPVKKILIIINLAMKLLKMQMQAHIDLLYYSCHLFRFFL